MQQLLLLSLLLIKLLVTKVLTSAVFEFKLLVDIVSELIELDFKLFEFSSLLQIWFDLNVPTLKFCIHPPELIKQHKNLVKQAVIYEIIVYIIA